MTKAIQFITAILLLSLIVTSCKKDSVEPEAEPILCDIHITDDITENTTWVATCTYYVDQSINIKNDAILTIEPGTTIKFATGEKLDVAFSASNLGNIIAVGTQEKPILFTSQAQVKSKGDWNSIWLWDGASASQFKYCKFEYAGGANDSEGAISLKTDAKVAIDYCTFEKNEDYGVYVYNTPGALVSFTNNTFIDNTINDLWLRAYNVSSIGEGNVFSKDIEVLGSDIDAPGDVVWRKHNADYIITTTDIDVGSATGTTLVIEAGASIKFSNFGMTIAYTAAKFGKIRAMGIATDPITITSAATTPSKGDWHEITFYDGSSTGSIFEYCNFSYGGAAYGGGDARAMIVFKYEQGSTVTIQNCSFSNSDGYGIMLDQPTNDTSYPTLANNTFTDNTLGDKNW